MPKLPTARDLDRLARDHFGEGKPGSVQVAVADNDSVEVVFSDGAGKEVARQPWHPDQGEKPRTGPLSAEGVRPVATATDAPPKPGAPAPLSPTKEGPAPAPTTAPRGKDR